MNDIASAVIFDCGQGFVAYLRFTNPRYDANLSHVNKNFLYRLIEGHCYRAGVK